MAFEFSKSGWWANKLILLKCFIDLSIFAMDYWKLCANYSWAATEKTVEVTCQSMLHIGNYLSNKYGNHWRRWFLNLSYNNWWAVVTVTDKTSFHTSPFIKCLDQRSFFTILSTQFFKKKQLDVAHHCVKTVRIRSFSCPEKYGQKNLRIEILFGQRHRIVK